MQTTSHWQLALDAGTGALARLAHSGDPHNMNWLCAPAENAWFPRSYGWGLGHLAMPGYPAAPRWEMPVAIDGLNVRYRIGALAITVTRTPRGEWLDEEHRFENTGAADLPIWGIGLCTPFNDNYPDAPTCVTGRCNAHLWCGGHVAYACALRMGGTGPHLGWVLTAAEIADRVKYFTAHRANYLLDVPPDTSGLLPPIFVERLREVGQLLRSSNHEQPTGETL